MPRCWWNRSVNLKKKHKQTIRTAYAFWCICISWTCMERSWLYSCYVFQRSTGDSSLVPAPSHGEEGSGTMCIPNLFCWNAEVTCINLFTMHNYNIQFTFSYTWIGMATSTETFCLGCGDDISHRVHDRRYLTTNDVAKRVIRAWKSLLEQKLALMARH